MLADRLAFCPPNSVTLDPYPETQGGKGGVPPRRELCMDPLSWQRLVETRVSYHYERRAKNDKTSIGRKRGQKKIFLMAHYSLQIALKRLFGGLILKQSS